MNFSCLYLMLLALLAAGHTLADETVAEAGNGAVVEEVAKVSALPAMTVEEPEEFQDATETVLKLEKTKDEVLEAIKDLSDKDAKIMQQPGMQRLARELNNFHGRQQHYRVAALVPSEAEEEDNAEDELEAVAEERAIRRRTRIRRRNSNNQVRRIQQNKKSTNRRNSSRRPSNGNRKLVKRRNSQNSNGRPSKRRNGNNSNKYGVRKSGKRQTNNRNQGVRNSNRNGSTRKNNKRKTNKSRKQKKRVKEINDDEEQMPEAA